MSVQEIQNKWWYRFLKVVAIGMGTMATVVILTGAYFVGMEKVIDRNRTFVTCWQNERYSLSQIELRLESFSFDATKSEAAKSFCANRLPTKPATQSAVEIVEHIKNDPLGIRDQGNGQGKIHHHGLVSRDLVRQILQQSMGWNPKEVQEYFDLRASAQRLLFDEQGRRKEFISDSEMAELERLRTVQAPEPIISTLRNHGYVLEGDPIDSYEDHQVYSLVPSYSHRLLSASLVAMIGGASLVLVVWVIRGTLFYILSGRFLTSFSRTR